MDKLKKIILILSISILLVFLTFLGIKKMNNLNSRPNISIVEDEGESLIESNDLTHYEYKVVSSCINGYIQKLNINNTQYYSIDSKGKKEKIVSEEELRDNIYFLLSDSFIKKNNIKNENIDEYINFYEEQLLCVPLRIKIVDAKNIKTFVTEVLLENLDFKYKGIKCFIVNVDFNNHTFSVEPTNKKYDEIDSINEMTKIERNGQNEFKSLKVSMENITREYMNLYKRVLLVKPELAYNYLDKEYREVRFGNVENFKKYIKNNYEELKRIGLEEYLVNNFDDYTEYVAKDKYGRIYTFKEKKILDYTVELDDYTILSEKFKQMYNDSKEDIKVKLNVDKWVKMLNNRDYRNAYKVLNKTFRENKFGNEEKFEAVMRKALPLHYKAMYGEFSDENGTYVQKIVLEDIEGKSDKEIKLSIIMELKDNYEFEMSFSLE